jgi:hypothetical protein
MVQPLLKPNRVKKRTKPFVRPQSEHKKRVKVRVLPFCTPLLLIPQMQV